MKFSFFKSPREQGCECTRGLFLYEIEHPKLKEKVARIRKAFADGDGDRAAELKRGLPCVTWQALSLDGSHKESQCRPNSMYMLDVDHVTEPMFLWNDTWLELAREKVNEASSSYADDIAAAKQQVLDELGILAVHVSPSGSGLRVVAKRVRPELTTIPQNQAWLADKLRIVTFDSACSDFSRLAFLCPREDFLYLNLDLFDMDDDMPFVQQDKESGVSTARGPRVQEREYTDAQKNFAYRGHKISDIAQMWLESRGEPQPGERNNYYMKMVKMFRNICDDDFAVMLCQLPDLGLDVQERERCIEHAIARVTSGDMPYIFYKFLVDKGIIEKPQSAAAVQTEPATVEEPVVKKNVKRSEKFPPLPPVFKEFCSLYPDEFVYPTIVALLPVLGTLATRLRATYIDGRVQTTSFIGVIFAPPASGKSFARDIVRFCTKDLAAHDKISVAKEKLWRKEMKVKRNSENPPEEPHAPYRIVQSVISVPRLLERQEDACGLHQFSFTEEIDTLKKSNSGGSYAQKSDLYRQAFDNAEYGQDYMSLDTFTGSVALYYNILMLGTNNQLYEFFNDAENGLVSRCCFAEILGQEFAAIPFFRSLTDKQQEAITAVLNRFEEMTYTRKNAMSEEYLVNKEVIVDGEMDFVRDALAKWLEQKRIECMKEGNISKDIFRRRSAVKAFRLAMICIGMFDKMTDARRRMIERFVLWFADQDLYHIEKAFGAMLRKQTSQKKLPETIGNLYDELQEQFSGEELAAVLRRHNKISRPSYYIGIWTDAGLVKRTGKSTYMKCNPKKSKK